MKSEPIRSDVSLAQATSEITTGPVRGWVVTALFVLAVFYTLYLTRALTLPIVLALLLHFLLRPAVRALQRTYVPIYVASGIVVLALLGALAFGGYALSGPVADWMEKAPQIVQQLERKLRPIKQKVQEVDKAAAQVEKITKVEPPRTPAVEVRPTSVRALVWSYIEPLLTGTVVMFFLLYFLLATGERVIERVAEFAVTREGAGNIINITNGIEKNVSGYLASVTLINAGLGACAALIAYGFGLPNPLLWGAVAMIFNFIPYLGSMTTLVVLTIVAILTFDSLSYALLVPASFLLVATIEGQVVTPFVLGHRLSLNPIVVFLGLIFWGWLWGPAGALLAVPVLVTVKIVCDHIPRLAMWSALFGR